MAVCNGVNPVYACMHACMHGRVGPCKGGTARAQCAHLEYSAAVEETDVGMVISPKLVRNVAGSAASDRRGSDFNLSGRAAPLMVFPFLSCCCRPRVVSPQGGVPLSEAGVLLFHAPEELRRARHGLAGRRRLGVVPAVVTMKGGLPWIPPAGPALLRLSPRTLTPFLLNPPAPLQSASTPPIVLLN
eukprot:364265-Chlamydomonas_euryale.AAC.2